MAPKPPRARPSWLVSYGEDVKALAVIVAFVAGVLVIGWFGGVLWAQHRAEQAEQAEQAAIENRASIESSIQMLRKAWCNQARGDSRGDLADGSCKE